MKCRRVVAVVVSVVGLVVGATAAAEATPSVYWTDQFGGSEFDEVTAIGVTARGSVVTLGMTSVSMVPGYTVRGEVDPFVASYDRNGNRQWVRQFGSDGDELPAGTIALAPNGDVIIAGTVQGGAFDGFPVQGGEDVFVVRLNRSGRQLWAVQIGSSGNDEANGIAVAPSGDIYLAINSNGAFPNGAAPPASTYGDYDAVIAKLDRRGALKWSRSLGTSERDFAYGVAVNRRNEVFVVGQTNSLIDPDGTAGGDLDGFMASYDRNGNRRWVRQSGEIGADMLQAVAITPQGDPVASGLSAAPNHGTVPGYNSQVGGVDGFVVKYSRAGTLVWANQHGTTLEDRNTSITVARNGHIFVGGITAGAWTGYANQGGTDLYVAHLTPTGTTVTARQLGTAATDGLSRLGLAVSMVGNTRVAFGSLTQGTLWGHAYGGGFDAFVGVIPAP